VACSPVVKKSFVEKYNNILCLKRVYSIGEKNRRWQARSWLNLQEKKYILAKNTFTVLGYPTIEEECEKYGGFVLDDNVDDLQKRCFMVLENVCKKVFQVFLHSIQSLKEK
jgi:hypothetical protein